MTIELTPQLEQALESEASRRGTTPQALAVQLIESQLPAAKPSPPAGAKTMYDVLKPHLDSLPPPSPDRPSSFRAEDSGRAFTDILLERRREGRL